MPWESLQADILIDMAEASLSWAQRERFTQFEAYHLASDKAYRARPEVKARDTKRKRLERATKPEQVKQYQKTYRQTDKYRAWQSAYYASYNSSEERLKRNRETRRARMMDPEYRESQRKKARDRDRRRSEKTGKAKRACKAKQGRSSDDIRVTCASASARIAPEEARGGRRDRPRARANRGDDPRVRAGARTG